MVAARAAGPIAGIDPTESCPAANDCHKLEFLATQKSPTNPNLQQSIEYRWVIKNVSVRFFLCGGARNLPVGSQNYHPSVWRKGRTIVGRGKEGEIAVVRLRAGQRIVC